MSSVVIVGSQWGDEGKGKMTDYLSKKRTLLFVHKVVIMQVTQLHLMVRSLPSV